MARKLDPRLKRLLEGSGARWSLEQGTKHQRLIVEGRLVAVVPFTPKDDAVSQNVLASVRRALRERA